MTNCKWCNSKELIGTDDNIKCSSCRTEYIETDTESIMRLFFPVEGEQDIRREGDKTEVKWAV